jgi:hypothetical protein
MTIPKQKYLLSRMVHKSVHKITALLRHDAAVSHHKSQLFTRDNSADHVVTILGSLFIKLEGSYPTLHRYDQV